MRTVGSHRTKWGLAEAKRRRHPVGYTNQSRHPVGHAKKQDHKISML